MNKNKRENIWATSFRLLRDCVPSKIRALWMRASRKITHGRNKGHCNYARTSCTESHAHKPCRYLICACVFSLSKLSWDCQFGVVCSASVSWHVPGGVSDQFVIPSRLCVLPAVRPRPRATLILAAPRDEAKCSTHSTQGQIKDSACWSWSLR